MTRDEARELLVDHINGKLPVQQRAALERVLEEDAELRQEAADMRREMGILRGALVDELEDVTLRRISSNVMFALRSGRQVGLRALPVPLRSYLRAAAVVLMIALGVVTLFILHAEHGIERDPVGAAKNAAPEVEEREPDRSDSVERTLTDAGAEDTPRAVVPITPAPEKKTIRMVFATSDPKIKIYWIVADNRNL